MVNHAISLVGGLVIASCAISPSRDPQRYVGTLSLGFEDSSFAIDGERWWAVGDIDWRSLSAMLDAHCDRPWGSLRVDVQGTLSPRGGFGHLGMFERKLEITHLNDATFVECLCLPDRPQ
jgi:hypothetical protein